MIKVHVDQLKIESVKCVRIEEDAHTKYKDMENGENELNAAER